MAGTSTVLFFCLVSFVITKNLRVLISCELRHKIHVRTPGIPQKLEVGSEPRRRDPLGSENTRCSPWSRGPPPRVAPKKGELAARRSDAEKWIPTVLRPTEEIPKKNRAMAMAAVFLRRSVVAGKLAKRNPKTISPGLATEGAAQERPSEDRKPSTPAVPTWRAGNEAASREQSRRHSAGRPRKDSR